MDCQITRETHYPSFKLRVNPLAEEMVDPSLHNI